LGVLFTLLNTDDVISIGIFILILISYTIIIKYKNPDILKQFSKNKNFYEVCIKLGITYLYLYLPQSNKNIKRLHIILY